MLGSYWLFITLVLVLAAAVLRQVPLLLVALLFFLASGVARLWARYALERVEYQRRLSAGRVFFGETVTLEIGVTNRKLLPLPSVHIQDELPEQLTLLKGKTSRTHKPLRVTLSNYLSLNWYHRLARRYPIQCLRRGYFAFGPATVRAGDPFGFFERTATEERLDYLLVYPRILPLEQLGIPSRDPFGDLRVRQHLFEDPLRVITTRDYVHGDPLKRLHWKATARLQRLQSRVFESTTTVNLALFLDTLTVAPPFYGISEQLLETAVIVAASIASYAQEKGYRLGLYVNEPYRYSDRLIKLPPSEHPEQLQRVLEALAQLQGWPLLSAENMLNREARGLAWGATLVVVTSVPSEALLAALARFRRAGRQAALVLVGPGDQGISLDGLPVYQVSDQVYWRELDSVQVTPPGQRPGP